MTRLIITATKYFIIGHTKTQEFFTFHSCLDKFSSEREFGHIFHTDMRFNGYRSLIRIGTRAHSFSCEAPGIWWMSGRDSSAGGSEMRVRKGHLSNAARWPRAKTAKEPQSLYQHWTQHRNHTAFHLCSHWFNVSERIPSAKQLKLRQLGVCVKTFLQTDMKV